MQLVAYGSQDVYLTGNPQITFWKVVYRRHTNFALEAVEQTFNGTAATGSNVVATISRNGDLIHKCYLVFENKNGTAVNKIKDAHNLIKSVELEIGGQQIDKQYGDWMTIWNELSLPEDKQKGYESMVGAVQDEKIYIPLQFYFCTNPGLALPLIALQYHEVRIKVEFGNLSAITASTPGSVPSTPKLWVDYVYLDTDERRKMAQSSHEYLITQLQADGGNTVTGSSSTHARLNFNHPVKELVWVVDGAANQLGNMGNLTELSSEPVHKLTLNGHERAAPREGRYFSHVQPYQHHTRIPNGDTMGGKINVYSFALKPEESQPSGSCNFSRIDNAQLVTTPSGSGEKTLKIFATNWNVLRIMSGMGGLAYSN